jgi:tRNA pseudouridine38-40 synthase
MARYFIRLAYNGSAYHGWQSQQNACSVQDVLEECLSLRLGAPIRVTGCGRTDTGVHARMYFAHFDCATYMNPDDLEELCRRLNTFLPDDIVVFEIREVAATANARFDAVLRTYQYRIHRTKDPFADAFSWYVHGPLDLELMQQASAILVEYNDFTSFSKLHSKTKNNLCRIEHGYWTAEGNSLVFTVSADRFLRNMVRAIVGTLIDVGKHKLDLEGFRRVIESKNRSSAGLSVPAKGLFLHEVLYPTEIFITEK